MTLLSKRVVGGKEALPKEFPFVVNVQNAKGQRSLQCVGTILHNQVIVVPAFCVVHPDTHSPVDRQDLVVGYGSEIRSQQKHARVVKIAANHDFVRKEMTNDIALLQVEPLDLGRSGAQRIPIYTGSIHAGQELQVMGWGSDKVSGGEWSEALKYTNVILSNSTQCHKSRNYNGIEGRVLCTENRLNPGHDVCDGEFGAALVVKINGHYQLLGMFSYHIDTSDEGYSQCAKDTSLAFYTHIYSYMGFIAATTQLPVDEFIAHIDKPANYVKYQSKYIVIFIIAVVAVWAMVKLLFKCWARYGRLDEPAYELAVHSAGPDALSDAEFVHRPHVEIMDITS
ncbi:Ovochymase-2 [Coemansia sp. RSA 1250]|nr:Ovochymase-2 [Coemansia sp. RSA 1250]